MQARKLLAVIGLVVLVFAGVAPVHAVNPSVVQISGNSAIGQTTLHLSLTAVTAGDQLEVVEYLGQTNSPCPYLLKPSDSLSGNWQSLGCTTDSANGGQATWFVGSSNPGSDLVTCNFRLSTVSDACYAFDVTNPAGPPTVLSSGTGVGSQVPITVNALGNSVLLSTVAFSTQCRTVTFSGQQPAGLNPVPYTPPSACTTNSNGLSGTYVTTSSAGTYQWTMDPSSCPGCGPFFGSAWSYVVIQIPGPTAVTTTTSYTATVTGWLAPDGVHFSNTFLLLIFPLSGMVIAVTMVRIFQSIGGRGYRIGDVGVHFALGGLTVGALLADLPAGQTSSQTALIPFAYPVVAALIEFLYWWNS